jgi:hypothetical protein
MSQKKKAQSITQQEADPLTQLLRSEAGGPPPEDLISAGVAVRELVIDVVTSTTHQTGLVISDEGRERLADELVKAIRAKPTRWAFIRLAEGNPHE